MTTGEKEDAQQAEVLFLGIDLSTQQVCKNRWKESFGAKIHSDLLMIEGIYHYCRKTDSRDQKSEKDR